MSEANSAYACASPRRTQAERRLRPNSVVSILVCGLVAACLPHPVDAQAPRLEVAVGYALLRDEITDLSFTRGWVVSAGARLKGWLSGVAEIASSDRVLPAPGSDLRFSLRSAMAGVKASRHSGRLTEFGQFLVGPVNGRTAAFDVSSSQTVLAVQAAIGLDYAIARRLTARLQIDVRRTGSSSTGIEPGRQIRIVAGMACIFR